MNKLLRIRRLIDTEMVDFDALKAIVHSLIIFLVKKRILTKTRLS